MAVALTHWLRRIFTRSGASLGDETPEIAPDRTFCVIGDIHGRDDLLRPLYQKLRADCGAEVPVIFLGDMIDRGPDSRAALTFIHDLCRSQPDRHVALMGNHEAMMIDFLDAPESSGPRWIHFGGRETLASFGIAAPGVRISDADLQMMRDRLNAALPGDMQDWLRDLPRSWTSGNIHCVHAAMTPDRPVDRQNPQVLTHGHRDFLKRSRTDGQIVVHGHTVLPDPVHVGTRISVDTGAYATSRLTAAVISPGACRFVT